MAKTVKQLIAEGIFGHRATYHFEYLWRDVDKNAMPDDGFGWVCLHATDSGACSSSGTHRTMRRALRMKERAPFACVIVVWDYEKMIRCVKRRWSSYSTEEKESINEALAGYTLRTEKVAGERRSSPFAGWSQRADQTASVAARAESGGPDSSGPQPLNPAEIVDIDELITELAAMPAAVEQAPRWPFPVEG